MGGEERHERCRYGSLTKAWIVDQFGERPIVTPLCGWQVPDPCPPAVRRAWGGNAIDVDDCAVCKAYDPL